jgi:hypothetical protein
MTHTGGCLCGAVRYALEGEPGPLINCHCRFCRRAHGAAFATTMLVPSRALRFTRGEDEIARHASRYFCRTCAGRLFNRLDAHPAATMLVVASLDDEPTGEPVLHVNLESMAPWYTIRDDAPRFDGFPPNAEASLQALEAQPEREEETDR